MYTYTTFSQNNWRLCSAPNLQITTVSRYGIAFGFQKKTPLCVHTPIIHYNSSYVCVCVYLRIYIVVILLFGLKVHVVHNISTTDLSVSSLFFPYWSPTEKTFKGFREAQKLGKYLRTATCVTMTAR